MTALFLFSTALPQDLVVSPWVGVYILWPCLKMSKSSKSFIFSYNRVDLIKNVWYTVHCREKEERYHSMKTNPKYSVMIAHGDPSAQQRISSALAATKLFQVIFTTHNGEVCIRQALRSQPDLVIADTLLAGVDGLEVLKQIKTRCGNTQVILLTTYHAFGPPPRGIGAGGLLHRGALFQRNFSPAGSGHPAYPSKRRVFLPDGQ